MGRAQNQSTPVTCGECGGTDVETLDESHSLSLYDHRDVRYYCRECDRIITYGKAKDPEEGLAFYLPERGIGAERPLCPDHDVRMTPTKAWVDQSAGETIQFKCEVVDGGEECQRVISREAIPAEDVDP